MKKTTRRSFLQSSALGVPGVMAVAGAFPPAETQAAAPGSREPDVRPTYELTRNVPIEEGFDLVVAGGGPAGTAAAVSCSVGGEVMMLASAGW